MKLNVERVELVGFKNSARSVEGRTMNPEERARINERLAKYMGWESLSIYFSEDNDCWLDEIEGFNHLVHPADAKKLKAGHSFKDTNLRFVPTDYTTDLVAVMEVSQEICARQNCFYILVGSDIMFDMRFEEIGGVWKTPESSGQSEAEAIARACYEAIGEGEE